MAFGDYIGVTGNGAGSGTAVSVSFTAPTSGNLLICQWSSSDTQAGAVTMNSSGWTLLNDEGASSYGGARWWKISDGTETSVSITLVTGRPWSVAVAEYEGPFAVSPLDVSDTYYFDTDGGPVTSLSATTTVTDSLAICSVSGRESQADATELGVSDSFTNDSYYSYTTGAAPFCATASRLLTSTTALTPDISTSRTISTFTTGGALAAFEKGAGGSSFKPAWARNSNVILGATG